MSTVTFLHGFMGSPEDWSPVVRGLSSTKLQSTQLHSTQPQSTRGQSPPECHAISIPTAADWNHTVAEILRQLSTGTVLVGYSMGGRLAMGCAVAAPERLRGLVVVAGHPGVPAADRQARQIRDQQLADQMLQSDPRMFLTEWYAQPVFASLNSRQIETEIDRKLKNWDPHRWSKLLRSCSVGVQPDYWGQLREIRVPKLAIAGTEDTKYQAIAMQMRDRVGCETRIVPAAGHMVHREQPAVLTEILRDFLQQRTNTEPAETRTRGA